jgi:hypothetical protein
MRVDVEQCVAAREDRKDPPNSSRGHQKAPVKTADPGPSPTRVEVALELGNVNHSVAAAALATPATTKLTVAKLPLRRASAQASTPARSAQVSGQASRASFR